MEQAETGEGHDHVHVVAGFDDEVIADGAAGLCDVGDAGLVVTLNVVREREERVRTDGDTGDGREVRSLVFAEERSRLFGEQGFPFSIADDVFIVLGQVDVDGVVSLRTADTVFEREVQDLLGLAEEPVVGFVAGKAGAVDPGLLSGTDTDGLE